MKKKLLLLSISIIFFYYGKNIYSQYESVNLYTTDRFSPIVILKDDKLDGIIGEFLIGSLGSKTKFHIKNLPWIRAQYEFLKDKNSIIAPFGRTKEREGIATWLSKVYDDPVCLFTIKPNKIVQTRDDITKLKRIALTLGVGHISKAREMGFDKKIVTYYTSDVDAKELFKGNVDAWLSGTLPAKYQWKLLKYDPSLLQCGKPVTVQQIFIATSKQSDKEFIKKLIEAMEKYKKTNKFKKLLEKYSVTYSPFTKIN
jgi:polar amino acid transport system substrate-binding protein